MGLVPECYYKVRPNVTNFFVGKLNFAENKKKNESSKMKFYKQRSPWEYFRI